MNPLATREAGSFGGCALAIAKLTKHRGGFDADVGRRVALTNLVDRLLELAEIGRRIFLSELLNSA